MNVLDLFSGIGGFSLGLGRAGMRTVAFCEIDPKCREVLRKHWPGVPIYEDIRTLTADRLAADGISVDVICGGFPCQDISVAGQGAGIEGPRSGLWGEYARLVRELRPKFVVVENVAKLLGDGMGRVLGDLAALGFHITWRRIRAADAGLPHVRARIWIVADRDGVRELQPDWGIGYERRWVGDRREGIEWVLSGGGILRSHDGVPAGLDRIGSIGNSVPAPISEAIGRAIMSNQSRHDS